MSRHLISAAVLAAVSLGAAACSKPTETATTTTTTAAPAAAPPPHAITVATGPPRAAGPAALANGPGLTGDPSQAAALSAPARSNGTTPSQGVIPPPSR
jgi:hypothetical protein